MKKILTTALLALCTTGGVAMADHGHGRGHAEVRGSVNVHIGGGVRTRPQHVRYVRTRVNMRSNRFVFKGGVERRYQRPHFAHRYYNYNVRPTVYVENMAPVEGYIWVNGDWNWSGREWVWTAGHYEPDASYTGTYYDNY